MDFERPAGAAQRRAQGETFGRQHVAPSLAARDRESRWDPDLFRRLGEAGLLGALLPSEYGGQGLSGSELCDLQEGLGAGSGDAGLALAWAAHLFRCAVPLWQLGSDEQRRRYLPGLCDGTLTGAFAHRERRGAGAGTGLQTRAVLDGDRWILDGAKAWVVNAPAAQLFLITAVTDPDQPLRGVTAFVVDRDTPGLHVGRPIDTTGLRTATISDLVLQRCTVPDRQRLGEVGRGLVDVFQLAERWERACGLAPWLGLMQSLLDGAIEAARTTSTPAGPMSSSQAVRARIADMKITLELCRRLQRRSSWAVSHGGDPAAAAREAAVARVFMLRGARTVAGHAAQIDGGDGLEAARPSARLERDAAALGLCDHGEDVLRSMLGGALLGLG